MASSSSTASFHQRVRAGLWRWEPVFGHALTIFCAVALVRLAIVMALQLHEAPFRAELHRAAESLATTGVYGNPYLLPTGPSAHSSPIYTVALAACYALFGLGVGGEIAAFALNITLAGVLYAALPGVAVALGLPRRAGVVAAWVGALVPVHFLNELRFGDAATSALALMAILVTARPIVEGRALTLAATLRLGLIWGIGLLVLPTLLCVITALTAVGVWVQRSWSYAGRVVVAAIVAVAMLTPWALRNRSALGELVWFRSNPGIELRMSYNDLAWPDAERTHFGGARELYHPFSSADVARQVRDEGEPAFNRRLQRDAFAWMRTHPQRTASLMFQRTLAFWFPPTSRLSQTLVLSGFSVLALLAIPRLLRYRGASILLLTTWLAFPPLYYVIQSSVRYRYPMLWTLLLAAALFAAAPPQRAEKP